MYIFPFIRTYIYVLSLNLKVDLVYYLTRGSKKKRTIARTRLKQEQSKQENEQEHEKEQTESK